MREWREKAGREQRFKPERHICYELVPRSNRGFGVNVI